MPPPGYYEFEGMNPLGTGRQMFILSKEQALKYFRDTGNAQAYLDSQCIPAVMDAPTATFEGLGRAGQDGAYCYCGRPTERRIIDDHITVPPPPGQTFLVFVSRECVIAKWGWEDMDPDTGYPENWTTRFGRRLWPTE